MCRVSVVIPVYHCPESLYELYRRIERALGSFAPWQIVFVNDACRIGSGRILAALEEADPRITLLTHARNQGQHRSLLDGMAVASGATVVLMDGDLQDPPEALPALISSAETRRWTAVFAGRRGVYQTSFRMGCSRLFKQAFHLMTGLPRDAGAFVAMPAASARSIGALDQGEPSHVIALLGAVGGSFLSIAVERAARPRGASAYSERDRAMLATSAARTLWRLKWRR